MYTRTLTIAGFVLFSLFLGWQAWETATEVVKTRYAADCRAAFAAGINLCGNGK